MRILSVELFKAFYNRWFIAALSVGLTLGVISALGTILLYLETEQQMLEWWGWANPLLSASSCFRFFMVSDYTQAATDLFYALLPLIAVMPYGWSLCREKNSGYLQNVFVRAKRVCYVACKAIAAALSGGTVVLLSLVLNIVVCACFIPAYFPDVSTVFNTGIYEFIMGSEMYYNAPVLFVCFYLVISFLFSAFWASFTVLLGGFTKDSARLLAGSFLFLYLFGALETKIGVLLFGSGTEYLSMSPLIWLRGVAIGGYTDVVVPIIWFLVLVILIGTLLALWKKGDTT